MAQLPRLTSSVSLFRGSLKERGVEFVAEPQKQPWGEFAIFQDPDGNRFVLSST
jgi:predicted enzyme related to lactoylglutathione lyase